MPWPRCAATISCCVWMWRAGELWWSRAMHKLPIAARRVEQDRALAHTGEELRAATRRLFKRSLHVRQVDAGSCNGCEFEVSALLGPYYDAQRFGIDIVASPRHADLL